MQGQYIQHGSSTPTARLFFYNTADGTPASVAFNAASLALVYARDNGANVALTLVTATLGTWVSSGFISRGGGVHDLYLPTAAALTGAKSLTITSTGLPTGVSMNPVVIPMGADDITAAAATDATIAPAVWANSTRTLTSAGAGGGATAAEVWAHSTRTLTSSSAPTAAENAAATDAVIAPRFAAIPAAPSAASNAAAVEAALLDNFDALPTAAEIAAAVAAPSAGTIAAAVAAPSAAAIAAAVAAPSASAIASAVAAPSSGTIATAVRGALAPDFAAIPVPPTASEVSTQTVADLAGVPGTAMREAVADALLNRNQEGGSNTGARVKWALTAGTYRVARVGNQLLLYAPDGTTVRYTFTIATDGTLLPVREATPV